MLNICLKSKKILNFTGRINAFRVIERLGRMNILGGQNTESVKRVQQGTILVPHRGSANFPTIRLARDTNNSVTCP